MPTGTETILVAEDEVNVLTLVKRTLAKQGYTVLAAATPQLALLACSTHPGTIHLLLTDVIMPELGGNKLAEKILALRPAMRVLYMSGYPADIMEQQGQLPPDLHVLSKPFSALTLAQHVRAALDAPPPPESASVASG